MGKFQRSSRALQGVSGAHIPSLVFAMSCLSSNGNILGQARSGTATDGFSGYPSDAEIPALQGR
jgi:hypothetical protein